MRFSTLALTVFATLALAHEGESHEGETHGAAISIKTVTSTSTHLSVVTSTGKPTPTPEAEKEKEEEVLYRVTETPSELIVALNATSTVPSTVKETSTAGNFTIKPTETKTQEEEGAEETGETTDGDKSAAGRREVGWGVMVGAGLVGAVIMGF